MTQTDNTRPYQYVQPHYRLLARPLNLWPNAKIVVPHGDYRKIEPYRVNDDQALIISTGIVLGVLPKTGTYRHVNRPDVTAEEELEFAEKIHLEKNNFRRGVLDLWPNPPLAEYIALRAREEQFEFLMLSDLQAKPHRVITDDGVGHEAYSLGWATYVYSQDDAIVFGEGTYCPDAVF